MRVQNLREFIKSIEALVASQTGKPLTNELELLSAGLQPFDELELRGFIEHLHRCAAVEVELPGKKKPASRAAAKPKAKSAGDVESVAGAVRQLEELYARSPSPECSFEEIDSVVKKIHDEFDAAGLKAVAMGFGLQSGVGTKGAAKKKIADKIVKRKADSERGREIERIHRRGHEVVDAVTVD